MTDNQKSHRGPLVRAAAAVCAAGAAVAATALVAKTRSWLKQMETQPREFARQRWTLAKASSAAAADTWRNGNSAKEAESVQKTESDKVSVKPIEKSARKQRARPVTISQPAPPLDRSAAQARMNLRTPRIGRCQFPGLHLSPAPMPGTPT